MQFHLNGFKPGDPAVAPPAEQARESEATECPPKAVDVLIVGCGPAGLTLAAQLAQFPGIKTRIIDQKPGPLLIGQADGIACRTMEMFEAYGFSERVMKEAYWVNEVAFWKPEEGAEENIVRSGRIQDTEDGLSEFPHVILNQARVHDFYLDVMRNAPTRLDPDYARRLVDLSIEPTSDTGVGPTVYDGGGIAYPITATLEGADPAPEGHDETLRARYVVGCDGAHSTVRKNLGLAIRGDSANQAWGVMDVLAVTDFPDIRLKALVQSATEGGLLIIPREGGYMVRLYVELDKLNEDERVSNRNITADHLIAAAGRILRPYSLDVKQIAWWSVYEIGQRLCDRFDDVPREAVGSRSPHVFIAGDACHTHSPKAGQGMNVSMADGFNLGWKLASVIEGRCTPEILATYSAERRAIAKELIDFDRVWAEMMSARPDSAGTGAGNADPAEFEDFFARHLRFTAGTETRYQPSIISAEPTHQHLAEGLVIGTRFHSAPVIRLADAKRVHLGHAVKADGRWRLFVFAGRGDPDDPASSVRPLCEFLAGAPSSPVLRYTRPEADVDSVIDVRAVFQGSNRELALETMPSFLVPEKGRYGLRDYEKLFCADLGHGPDIFEMRGIDRERGCIVIVRPDQYVAHILPLDAHDELAAFFGAFMIRSATDTKP